MRLVIFVDCHIEVLFLAQTKRRLFVLLEDRPLAVHRLSHAAFAISRLHELVLLNAEVVYLSFLRCAKHKVEFLLRASSQVS